MAASREKKLAHRKKKLLPADTSVKLVEPMSLDSLKTEKALEKVKVSNTIARSALVLGDGRDMNMDLS
jgi:large subunit ribosomal protein L24e